MHFDPDKLERYYSDADGTLPPNDIALSDVDLDALPRHISFIMDGNGRWAQARGMDRSRGHVAGVDALRETITTGVRLGIDCISAYAFSTENWNRPKREVDLLMGLFAKQLYKEMPLFKQENVRLVFLGDLEALPDKVQATFQMGVDETAAHTGMVLALAVNYGSRAEITRAARLLAERAVAGEISPADITPEAFAAELYTQGLPEVDLLVRTSGELRLSNYLLWQLAYSEFYVTDLFWPDFDRWELLRAIAAYQGRERRFGGVVK